MADIELREDVKQALRVTGSDFDQEIADIILAAKSKLYLSGVALEAVEAEPVDPLVKRAIIVYAKSEFGMDNPDSEKYMASFDSLARHLALSGDYQDSVS